MDSFINLFAQVTAGSEQFGVVVKQWKFTNGNGRIFSSRTNRGQVLIWNRIDLDLAKFIYLRSISVLGEEMADPTWVLWGSFLKWITYNDEGSVWRTSMEIPRASNSRESPYLGLRWNSSRNAEKVAI